MAAPTVPRQTDNKHLAMLALRRKGLTYEQVARRLGTTAGTVRTTIARIIADDLRFSGEQPADVRRAYAP